MVDKKVLASVESVEDCLSLLRLIEAYISVRMQIEPNPKKATRFANADVSIMCLASLLESVDE